MQKFLKRIKRRNMLFSRCIWILLLENVVFGLAWVSENKLIEDDLLKNYDKRHRPVRSESTTMKIQVFLMINHIEKVVSRKGVKESFLRSCCTVNLYFGLPGWTWTNYASPRNTMGVMDRRIFKVDAHNL